MLAVAKKKGPPTEFGAALKRLRAAAGLSQKELAVAAGMGRVAVAKLETSPDANPSWDTVLKLAVALGVSPGEFTGG